MKQVKQNEFHPNISERAWVRDLWELAESKWIARDGQDKYYREKVAIPGIIEAIEKTGNIGQFELIDIGSGDGLTTNHLIMSMVQNSLIPSKIVLIDRSKAQLKIASSQKELNKALIINSNLLDNKWVNMLPDPLHRRIFISMFLVQELPDLRPLLKGLNDVMTQKDIAIFLTVAPSYSSTLLQSGAILESQDGDVGNDWYWKGMYPIDGLRGRFYLPHYQRDLDDYKKQLIKYGFHCIYRKHLSVPVTREAHHIFRNTVYYNNIIGIPSSVVFAFQNKAYFMRSKYDPTEVT